MTWNEIWMGIIGLCITIGTTVIIPLLRTWVQRYIVQIENATVKSCADEAVQYVEQILVGAASEMKYAKAYASLKDKLANHNIKLPEEQIKSVIEAAVQRLISK